MIYVMTSYRNGALSYERHINVPQQINYAFHSLSKCIPSRYAPPFLWFSLVSNDSVIIQEKTEKTRSISRCG